MAPAEAGVGDSAAEEESEAHILDGAREVEAVAVLVGRLVVGVLLVRLDLLLAIAGRLSDDVRPELQIRGGDTGLREVELIRTVKPPPVREFVRLDRAALRLRDGDHVAVERGFAEADQGDVA